MSILGQGRNDLESDPTQHPDNGLSFKTSFIICGHLLQFSSCACCYIDFCQSAFLVHHLIKALTLTLHAVCQHSSSNHVSTHLALTLDFFAFRSIVFTSHSLLMSFCVSKHLLIQTHIPNTGNISTFRAPTHSRDISPPTRSGVSHRQLLLSPSRAKDIHHNDTAHTHNHTHIRRKSQKTMLQSVTREDNSIISYTATYSALLNNIIK